MNRIKYRSFWTLLLSLVCATAAQGDEAEIAQGLKGRGAQLTVSKGVVTSVSVQDSSKWSDADFRQLTQLKHLKMLSLSGGLDDSRLALLAELGSLEYLQTNLVQISDDGVKPLAQLKNLKNLKFFHPGKAFSGAGLAHLAQLPNLERLTVAGSLAFNDDGLAAVARLSRLTEFRTWHAGGTDAGVAKLAALKTLKSLTLGQRLTYQPPACPRDETLAILARLTSLEALQLEEARLTEAALRQLARLPALKKLTLAGIDLSGAELERLRQEMPALKIDWTEPSDIYRKRIRALFGSNWDRFRGPNGSGVADDTGIPLAFGPRENLVWKVALPGNGNSSPVIWGSHLFLQTASDDGTQRSLLCLDTADGRVRWTRSIPAVPAKIRADSSLASATPTTDGAAVYVSFWDGKEVFVIAYDFQGEKLWTKELGPWNSQHGTGASPILYRDTLFLANDMDKDDFYSKVPNPRPSTLVALDRRTGRLLWEAPRSAERACYSAPFLLERPGQKTPALVVTSTTAVTAYEVEAGVKLWEVKGWQDHAVKVPMRTVASPALAGDILCVCSGGDAGRFAVGLELPRPGSDGGPHQAWENRKDFPYVASPLARGAYFYFVNDAGYAGCYEARTGARIWFERLSDTGFHASPLLINGKVYATSTAGDVYVFAAEPTFRLLAHNELGETTRATAAVAAGRLYIRGQRHLYCFGRGTL